MKKYYLPFKFLPNIIGMILMTGIVVSSIWLLWNAHYFNQYSDELSETSVLVQTELNRQLQTEKFKRFIIYNNQLSEEFDWVALVENKLNKTFTTLQITRLTPLKSQRTNDVFLKEMQLRVSPVLPNQLGKLCQVLEFEKPAIRIREVLIERITPGQTPLDVTLILQMIILLEE